MVHLADLIRKQEPREVATAVPVASAAQQRHKKKEIAKIVTLAVANSQSDKNAEGAQAENFRELDLLVNFVVSSNKFTEQELFNSRRYARNDPENSLLCFRELAAACRLLKVNALVEESPSIRRAIYADTTSDPHDIIVTIAI